ncbi:uncharacterized protein LOC110040411 isoform X2 [Orbicella faveolata]|uniref:uncharacterized protein LOC110040411 isoform X2 n=1 Tax=Orbicella faveolata TaxID=48498 RepID=UPI0009E3C87A|nr:uncharacterized protein LOC110040411 isoform X2 [Orbicella faveolata]
MTKAVVDSLTALAPVGQHVSEVAHEHVPALRQWLATKGIRNSYDSWHGGKGVKKAIKKVASRLVRDSERSWLAELSDKVKCTKTHIYYAMKNCNGDADKLKRYIVNIVDHYQICK